MSGYWAPPEPESLPLFPTVPLFPAREDNPLSARNDPDTSREAEEKLVSSGEQERQMRAVEAVLAENPGSTSRELGALGKLINNPDVERYIFARRLPDLAKRKRAVRGEKRPCRITGENCVTWTVALQETS